MSVGLIAHYKGPCLGIGQYLQRLLPFLVKELVSKDIKVRILASPNAFEKTAALQELSEFVSILPPLDYSPAMRYLWCATRLSNYCRQEGLDVLLWLSNPIVLPWHPSSLIVIHDVNEWKVAQKYGNRLKTTLRSLIYLDASLRSAQKIIVISQATKRDVLYFRPQLANQQKLVTILNGADSPLTQFPICDIVAPQAPFLLSVGRIDPSAKRLPEAVALVNALRELSSQPWELHLIGGTNDTTRLSGEAFLESVQHLAWVTYHGYVEDLALAQWYRQATAVIFLSDDEGFGFPIAEAASFGRWVVISQANEAGREAGFGAIIPVEPNNPQASAKTLLHQLQQKPFPLVSNQLPTWQTAAFQYTQQIDAVLKLNKE